MKTETIQKAAKRLIPNDFIKVSPNQKINVSLLRRNFFIDGADFRDAQLLEFLHSEITERRDYSASKMCEKVIEFINNTK